MDENIPQAPGRLPNDPLDKASESVASMATRAIAPLTYPPASLDADQLRGNASVTRPTSLASDSGGITHKQAFQSQRSIEQQNALALSNTEAVTGTKRPKVETFEVASSDEEGPSAAMRKKRVKVGQQENNMAQGSGKSAIDDNNSVEAQSDHDSDMEMTAQVESAPSSSKSKGEIDMLDKYAFDLRGNAYTHCVPQRFTHATSLYVGKLHPQSTSLEDHLVQMATKNEMDICPPLLPHENETKAFFPRKDVECVWVGMLLSDARQEKAALVTTPSPPQHTENSLADEAHADGPAEKRTPKKAKKGTRNVARIVDLSPGDMNIISYDPNALRVVAKKPKKATKNWCLYALLNPDPSTKLCQGWKVGLDEVFYFRAFRADEAKSYMPRRHATQEKIRKLTFPDGPSNPPMALPQSEKSVRFLSPPEIQKSPKLSTEQPVSKESSVDLEVGGAHSQDADSSRNRAMSSPLSSLSGDESNVGDEELMVDLDVEGLNGADHNEVGDHFASMVDTMMQNLTKADFEIDKVRVSNVGTPDKKVSFRSVSDQFSNNTKDDNYADDDEVEAGPGAPQLEVDNITIKITSLAMKMSEDKDQAGLRQGYKMLKCIEQRCRPSTTSALGLYLNVPPGEDVDPHACVGMLRELLDLFPNVEDIDMDNHVLAWMVRGLQLTSQSVDIELLPSCLKFFSDLFKAKFKDTSNHQARLQKTDLVDMICQALDDAEELEMGSSRKASSSKKDPSRLLHE